MSEDTTAQTEQTTVNDDATAEAAAQTKSEVSAQDFASLVEKIEKQEALINKLREHEQKSLEAEKAAKKEKQTEVERVTELYEAKLNSMALDAALEGELGKANARNIELAKKVIDTNSITVVDGRVDRMTVKEAIEALKASDNYLFGDGATSEVVEKPKAAKPGRPAEGATEDIIKKEINAAKTQKELNAILRKYNI
jgi:hypothetical protein